MGIAIRIEVIAQVDVIYSFLALYAQHEKLPGNELPGSSHKILSILSA